MTWLRQRREQLHINQEELAARLQLAGFDIARSSISHWENDRFKPPFNDPEFTKAFASVLKLSVNSMLKQAGYEIVTDLSENARHAAEIVDSLPADRQRLAIGLLEQLQRED
jgi:transcriptional regulator with XRE-family HTH domain